MNQSLPGKVLSQFDYFPASGLHQLGAEGVGNPPSAFRESCDTLV